MAAAAAAITMVVVATSTSAILIQETPKLRHGRYAPTRNEVVKAESRDEKPRHLTGEPFTLNLLHAACPGVSGRGKSEAPDMASCAALCEADPGCDLWQYCPYLYEINSCLLHDQVSWTLGNQTRCYLSTATSSREICIPDKYWKWQGAARAGSTRVPVPTAPVSRKRGFSGYLFATDDSGKNEIRPCNDAAALDLDDSWYYNWMIRTVSKLASLRQIKSTFCHKSHSRTSAIWH